MMRPPKKPKSPRDGRGRSDERSCFLEADMQDDRSHFYNEEMDSREPVKPKKKERERTGTSKCREKKTKGDTTTGDESEKGSSKKSWKSKKTEDESGKGSKKSEKKKDKEKTSKRSSGSIFWRIFWYNKCDFQ